jgi:hypothetical protein
VEQAHLFQSSRIDWQPHPTLKGIRVKSLENSQTFSKASVTLVQVDPGGVIEPHLHEEAHETAFVLSVQQGDEKSTRADEAFIPLWVMPPPEENAFRHGVPWSAIHD